MWKIFEGRNQNQIDKMCKTRQRKVLMVTLMFLKVICTAHSTDRLQPSSPVSFKIQEQLSSCFLEGLHELVQEIYISSVWAWET